MQAYIFLELGRAAESGRAIYENQARLVAPAVASQPDATALDSPSSTCCLFAGLAPGYLGPIGFRANIGLNALVGATSRLDA
jgi:hypothetical protein